MASTMIGPDSRLAMNPDLVSGSVDTDVILMSIASGNYFQLNRIGGEILEILQDPMTLAGLIAILGERFRVDPGTLEADLQAFLQQLVSREIISIG